MNQKRNYQKGEEAPFYLRLSGRKAIMQCYESPCSLDVGLHSKSHLTALRIKSLVANHSHVPGLKCYTSFLYK